MDNEVIEQLRQWLRGEGELAFDEVERLRRKLLEAHGRDDRVPPPSWWANAPDGEPGWVYRRAGERLVDDYDLVLVSDVIPPEERPRVWANWRRTRVPKYRIGWGAQSRVYARPEDLHLLSTPGSSGEGDVLLPDGQPIAFALGGEGLTDGGKTADALGLDADALGRLCSGLAEDLVTLGVAPRGTTLGAIDGEYGGVSQRARLVQGVTLVAWNCTADSIEQQRGGSDG